MRGEGLTALWPVICTVESSNINLQGNKVREELKCHIDMESSRASKWQRLVVKIGKLILNIFSQDDKLQKAADCFF